MRNCVEYMQLAAAFLFASLLAKVGIIASIFHASHLGTFQPASWLEAKAAASCTHSSFAPKANDGESTPAPARLVRSPG